MIPLIVLVAAFALPPATVEAHRGGRHCKNKDTRKGRRRCRRRHRRPPDDPCKNLTDPAAVIRCYT